jgi:acetyl-CoA carboxylase carboxyl transferase subunit beta
MMEDSTYSILSPEGFATILWKDGKRAKEASSIMGITAMDLQKLQVIETIIPEFGGANEKSVIDISFYMKEKIMEFLEKYHGMDGKEIADERYKRFRKY